MDICNLPTAQIYELNLIVVIKDTELVLLRRVVLPSLGGANSLFLESERERKGHWRRELENGLKVQLASERHERAVRRMSG